MVISQENVLKALEGLGLAKLDAQVYVFLGKRGPQKAIDIAKAFKIRKQRLYTIVKNLERKGLVNVTLEHPAKFSALPFEKALDLFVKSKRDEAWRIESGKEELFSDWKSIYIAEAAEKSPKFSVIEGRNFIYPRLRQMIEEARSQLSIISTVSGLVRADQFGLLDDAFNHARRTNTKFRFITELTRENLQTVKRLVDRLPKGVCFEGRTPEFGQKLTSRMLIRDNEEAVFFVSQQEDKTAKEVDDVCLWTNSDTIVNSFATVFEDLWRNSTDIEKKIKEVETGRPSGKTCIIDDSEVAKKKYDDVIDFSRKEIVIVTSSEGLIEVWKHVARLKERSEKGVIIKIMANIVGDNLQAAFQLSQFCNVRHVPTGYLETTIVDNTHLFQFKPISSATEKLNGPSSLEGTFYTNDPEYVKRARQMLDYVWRNAVAPSTVTVEEITKPQLSPTLPVPDDVYTASRKDGPYQKMMLVIDEKPLVVTEEYFLNKMINAKRKPVKNPMKDTGIYYGSEATAVIRTPKEFNLPEMMLIFFDFNKNSSYGAEDYFSVHLWLETPEGCAFVPVAIAGDNPKALESRKWMFSDTPASKNCHILKKTSSRSKFMETHCLLPGQFQYHYFHSKTFFHLEPCWLKAMANSKLFGRQSHSHQEQKAQSKLTVLKPL